MYDNDSNVKDGLIAIIGLITLILWGYGVYYFGVEAHASDWEIGKVAILGLWVVFAAPLVAGAIAIVLMLLASILYLLLMPFVRK